jgi:hypothetical protein
MFEALLALNLTPLGLCRGLHAFAAFADFQAIFKTT